MHSTFNVKSATFADRHWMLDVRRWMFDVSRVFLIAIFFSAFTFGAPAQSTNAVPLAAPQSLPDVGASLGRVMLMLAVVLGLFLGGVWLFRNWQRLTTHRGQAPKLNVVEVRSLGGRHALYVVAYEQERFLLASSPTGVNLLSHLQPAEETPATAEQITPPQSSFAQTLAQMLKRK
jgi:flagellar biogenesis protein FliO